MDVEPFALERFFARYEHEADVMLAESGIRPLPVAEFDTDPDSLGYVIPTNGDPDLRATLAGRYDRSAEEVLCTCGAQEANFTALAALIDEHAVCITPTYQALHSVPGTFGDVTRVDLAPPEWTLDVEAVKDAVRPETDVVVCNNPNNPTGRYHDEATVEALYEIAADAGAYLLCDEVYRLLDPDPLPPVASMGEHGVSTASVTKAHGLAGCRFGWLAGPREVVDAAWRWKDYTTISPSTLGQHVARQAIRREDEILEANRALAAEHRERVAAFLDRHGLDWYEPTAVNGFVTVPDGFETAREFCERVVEEVSVVLAPGDAFGQPDYFRIGFGLPTEALADGLSRLDDFLEAHA
jgi:aspartate/methionine/tyrosine aminotransferase